MSNTDFKKHDRVRNRKSRQRGVIQVVKGAWVRVYYLKGDKWFETRWNLANLEHDPSSPL